MLFVFSSCKKEDEVVNLIGESPVISETEGGVTKASANWSIGMYQAQTAYKNAYYHVKQKTGECSWTNYVIAAAAVIRGKGNTVYPYGAGSYENKVQHCKNWTNSNTAITSIESYCKQVDIVAGYPINCTRKAVSLKTDAADEMLSHISSKGTPFLYVGGVGGIGHYFTVWSIYWGGDIYNSDVYYTNTLDAPASTFAGQVKSQNLNTFLSSNVNNYHNLLFLY
ncbi:MAG: hypothetical protein LBI53_03110 [Candidatus Peribacteria bacterium]|nr:hypothetical protein [Candidatus Peribacteria bacterium]